MIRPPHALSGARRANSSTLPRPDARWSAAMPRACFDLHPFAACAVDVPRPRCQAEENRADQGPVDAGLEPFGRVHFKSSGGESAASLSSSRLPHPGSAPPQDRARRWRASRLVPPGGPRQVGRRPPPDLETEPVKKLVLHHDLVTPRRHFVGKSRHGEWTAKSTISSGFRAVFHQAPYDLLPRKELVGP